MKKLYRILIYALLIIAISSVPVQAKTIKHNLAETTITVSPKDKVNLRIPGVKTKNVVWKSKNKGIAKVNKSGVMTAVKNGKTKITAKCYKITFTVNVIVIAKTQVKTEPQPSANTETKTEPTSKTETKTIDKRINI